MLNLSALFLSLIIANGIIFLLITTLFKFISIPKIVLLITIVKSYIYKVPFNSNHGEGNIGVQLGGR